MFKVNNKDTIVKVLVSIEIVINPFQTNVVFYIHRNQPLGLQCKSIDSFMKCNIGLKLFQSIKRRHAKR